MNSLERVYSPRNSLLYTFGLIIVRLSLLVSFQGGIRGIAYRDSRGFFTMWVCLYVFINKVINLVFPGSAWSTRRGGLRTCVVDFVATARRVLRATHPECVAEAQAAAPGRRRVVRGRRGPRGPRWGARARPRRQPRRRPRPGHRRGRRRGSRRGQQGGQPGRPRRRRPKWWWWRGGWGWRGRPRGHRRRPQHRAPNRRPRRVGRLRHEERSPRGDSFPHA